MGSVFFLVNGVLFGWIWLDAIIFNFVMILINIIYSIPLLKPYIDVSLNKIEQRVYDNVFAKSIDKRTCKRILQSAKLTYLANKNFLTQQNSLYTGVYLVAHMKQNCQLVFTENDQEIFRENKPYAWMGVIEYDMMRKAKLKNETFKWPISIYLDERKGAEPEKDKEFIRHYPEPLYIYFFEFEKLQKLYTEENGTYVRNALHSIWLESMCHKIIEIDMKVSKYLGQSSLTENKASPEEQNKEQQGTEKKKAETNSIKHEEVEKYCETIKENLDFHMNNTETCLIGNNNKKESFKKQEKVKSKKSKQDDDVIVVDNESEKKNNINNNSFEKYPQKGNEKENAKETQLNVNNSINNKQIETHDMDQIQQGEDSIFSGFDIQDQKKIDS